MTQISYIAAGLLIVNAAVAAAARRLGLASPILLVVAGVALALVPGLPTVELAPDAVLLLFLPPILYYAAFGMSWRAFREYLRPILLLAIGCVLVTTVAVGAAAHLLIGLPWAVGFVLGAMVSPPDVVAPLAVARRLGIPRRITVVLEGEGLVNDATALVLFSFAVASVANGAFSIPRAAVTFALIVLGEILYGLAIGWVMLRLRHAAGDPRIEVTLSLLTPFLAFWVPHRFGGSGVLATVVAGLYVGWKGVELIRSNTRLQAVFFWDFVTYILEGELFLLTGLQARVVLRGLHGMSWERLLLDGLVVSLVVIVVRFLWVFPGTYLPRWLLPRLKRADPSPPWQFPFAIAFTGIRGVVSLAAALSLPVQLAGGVAFPHRNVLLFLTFTVILVTLVVQGVSLPVVMRKLGLVALGRLERDEQARRELTARVETGRAALNRLTSAAEENALGAEVIEPLRTRHQARIDHLVQRKADGDGAVQQLAQRIETVELAVIGAERGRLNELLREGTIGDDVRRRIERDLDLTEERIRRNTTGVVSDGEG